MSWRTRFAAAFTALTALISLPAGAAILYGALGSTTVNSNLYVMNTSTGAATPIGLTGQALTGMAYDNANGTMYGVTSQNAACARCLVTINLTTAAATVVGPLTLTISEIEFGSNGTLYGWSETGDVLASINLTTGTATTIPPSGIGTFGDGMALVGGVMYLMPEGDAGTYYTVNTTTGLATAAGTLTGSPGAGCCSVAAATTDPASGQVFAVVGADGSGQSFLVKVNVATGAITNVGTSVLLLDALAFGPNSGGVPTMSREMLIALFAMVLVLGVLAPYAMAKFGRSGPGASA